MVKPEEAARQRIDEALSLAGWFVQDAKASNVYAARGVAIREFPLKTGHGSADYLLYVDGHALGLVEAKKAGETLTGVEVQSEKYAVGLPEHVPAPMQPLPVLVSKHWGRDAFYLSARPEASQPRSLLLPPPRNVCRMGRLRRRPGRSTPDAI
jgi:type I restriction enzyme R subunit